MADSTSSLSISSSSSSRSSSSSSAALTYQDFTDDTWWKKGGGTVIWDGSKWTESVGLIQLVPVTSGPNNGWQVGFRPEKVKITATSIRTGGVIFFYLQDTSFTNLITGGDGCAGGCVNIPIGTTVLEADLTYGANDTFLLMFAGGPSGLIENAISSIEFAYSLSSSSSSRSSSSSSTSSSSSSSSSSSTSSSSSSSSSSSLSISSSSSSSSASPATVTWGYHTGVEEDFDRNFAGNWDTTANVTISGSGDSEILTFGCPAGQTISEEWLLGVMQNAQIKLNKYTAGDDCANIAYKTASTESGLAGTEFVPYDGLSFVSLGWVQIGITYGLTIDSESGVLGSSTVHDATTFVHIGPAGTDRIVLVAVSWEDNTLDSSVESCTFDGIDMTSVEVVQAATGRMSTIHLFALYDDDLPAVGGFYLAKAQVQDWGEATVQPFLSGLSLADMHQHPPSVTSSVELSRPSGTQTYEHTTPYASDLHSPTTLHLAVHNLLNSEGTGDSPPNGALYIAHNDEQVEVQNQSQAVSTAGITYRIFQGDGTANLTHTLSSVSAIPRHIILSSVWDANDCTAVCVVNEVTLGSSSSSSSTSSSSSSTSSSSSSNPWIQQLFQLLLSCLEIG